MTSEKIKEDREKDASVLKEGDLPKEGKDYYFDMKTTAEYFNKEGKILICKNCDDYQTMSATGALNHVKTSHKEVKWKPYQCKLCNATQNNANNMKRHILAVHRDIKPYVCDHCGYRAIELKNVQIHIEVRHLKLFQYKCKSCPSVFKSKGCLNSHIRNRHDESARKFECGTCHKRYTSRQKLKNHEMIHAKVKPFKCDLCSFRSAFKGTLKRHREYVHLKLKKIPCLSCDYRARDNHDLRVHSRQHSDTCWIKCPSCDYKTKYIHELKAHELIHTGQEFECYHCEFKTVKKYALNMHIENKHLGKKKRYQCNLCPYVSNTNRSLYQHKHSVHLAIRFSCKYCNKKFTQKSNMKTHIQGVHLNLKRYTCHICSYSNNHNNQVLLHYKRVHEKEKNYTCDHCHRCFVHKFEVTKHIQRFHLLVKPLASFGCLLCDLRSPFKQVVSKHMRIMHCNWKENRSI